MTTDEKQHVADLAKRHVAPRNILLSLQDKFPENVTRITQVYKHKSVIEKEIRGPRSEIQHLFKLIEDAGYVYWSRKQDDSEVVREIFWAHPDSPPEKWMSLPDMGYLIANRYNVVLVCLGNPCITFFPMTSSHSPNVSICCIGFVNQNHWVQVNMKEGFPLPPVTLDWNKFRSHIATTWMLGFAGRMQH
ncbi:hypothetical protein KIW84_072129 [Lathyrus oleraceus]|uniref:Uncharacterized protein n=1 Tax=Pisum sativum TaxID=3888 RepID=A0A9D4VLD9_PEA|nr:hypothetical protein KIW84_072129 [Pisum sativum]